MNIEAAENCLQKGLQCYQKQEIENALKWLRKSNSLNPTQEAQRLIAMVASKPQPQSSSSSSRPKAASPPKPSRPAEPSYTQEQKDLVNKIIRIKDYYEVLGVARNAKDDEFKRAYRKLAIKLHPDKNTAPQAQDAFKLIAKAYDCLSNPDKKAHYDRFGEEKPNQGRQQSSGGHYEEEFFNPEDIFQAFFGGGFQNENVYFNGQRVRRRQPQPRQHRPQRQGNTFNLGAYLPLIFIVFTILSNLSGMFSNKQEASYSLRQSYSHSSKYLTQHKQPFFSNSQFHENFPSSSAQRREVYHEVNQAWLQHWSEQCHHQQQQQQYLQRYASASTGHTREQYEQKAKRVDMTTCEAFYSLRAKMGRH